MNNEELAKHIRERAIRIMETRGRYLAVPQAGPDGAKGGGQ